MSDDKKILLHVGCGPLNIKSTPKGFQDGTWRELRLDIDDRHSPDILGSITGMPAVADNSVDALYSSHNIEHVFAHEVELVLKEFRRVLKPTGFAVVTCPDIQALGEEIAKGNLTRPLYMSGLGPISALDILYGHGKDIKKGQHYMAHKTAFTAQTLIEAMTASGFASVGMKRVTEGSVNLWAVAFKSQTDQETMRHAIVEYANRWRAPKA